MSAFEIAFFRSVFNLVLSSVYLFVAGEGLTVNIDSTNRCVLFVRCLSGAFGFVCFALAIEHLPLSIFFVVTNTTPFMICVLACLWLKDVITWVEVINMIGAFSGIIMVGLSKKFQESKEKEEVKS